MSYIIDRDGLFEVRASGQGENSGNGVFCVDDVKAGTMLPYTGVAFKESKSPDDMDRTYVIGGEYNNSRGNPCTSKTYTVDGNPFLEPVFSLEEYKKIGCQINEASKGSKVNSMFCVNPLLTKESFKESFVSKNPINATLVVITEDLKAGTELLTSYGSGYGKRNYKPSKLKRKEHDAMVDRAYNFVDLLDVPEPKRTKKNPEL